MKPLFTLLTIPMISLVIIFIIRYRACLIEYKKQSRSLRHKLRHSEGRLKKHWEKRLKWQKYLLIPFVGRYMRDYALRKYANRKRINKSRG